MRLTHIIKKNEPTISSCSARKGVEKVVATGVEEYIEDSDNIN